jgi:hypothetical protein
MGPCCTLLFEPGIDITAIDALRAELPLQFRRYRSAQSPVVDRVVARDLALDTTRKSGYLPTGR